METIKKNQSEMKDTLTEIKNNLQGSTVEWIKLRIRSAIWNIRKQKSPSQNRTTRRKMNHKMKIV